MSIDIRNITKSFHNVPVLKEINIDIKTGELMALLGPSGCGKTTLLRIIAGLEAPDSGSVFFQGEETSRQKIQSRKVGFVFQHYALFRHMTVFENVAYAPRRAGIYDRHELEALVEKCLRQAMLWDEVKDRLDLLGTRLSGGQQQRLTLARALSLRPEILCLDEFSIAIDPITTMRIEDILRELKNEMTIVLVTNLVQQARRLADHTAFFSNSRLIEVDETEKLFTQPAQRLTERYVTGDYG